MKERLIFAEIKKKNFVYELKKWFLRNFFKKKLCINKHFFKTIFVKRAFVKKNLFFLRKDYAQHLLLRKSLYIIFFKRNSKCFCIKKYL